MTLFKSRYRIESARMPGWDYSRPGWYFVTICVRPRGEDILCAIERGRVRLSPAGRIVADEWRRTEAVRENVRVDAWVVMPDHLHGIIRITHRLPRRSRPAAPNRSRNPTGLRAGSLGAIIGQFKTRCTKRIRAAGHPEFTWQPRFHDRIIPDREALEAIRRYIANNPRRWKCEATSSSGGRVGRRA